MTISDIIKYVEDLSGFDLDAEDGVQHGSADREITGLTLCWTATPEAIRAASAAGHELVFAHESLDFAFRNPARSRTAPEAWKATRIRHELLDELGLTFLRVHSPLDHLCIHDDFALTLGLGKPVEPREHGNLVRVYDIEPCTLEALIDRVKERLGMPTLRVTSGHDPSMTVSRVGLPWGGTGLFLNTWYQQSLAEKGCDVFIAGESDNIGMRFARECGIPMIETSHEISENPGLRHFAEMLSEAFPQLDVKFFENPCVWEMK